MDRLPNQCPLWTVTTSCSAPVYRRQCCCFHSQTTKEFKRKRAHDCWVMSDYLLSISPLHFHRDHLQILGGRKAFKSQRVISGEIFYHANWVKQFQTKYQQVRVRFKTLELELVSTNLLLEGWLCSS